jgi:hypothetical protein
MYRIPLTHLVAFGMCLLLGRRRSFTRDAESILKANLRHPRRIEGLGNAVTDRTCIVVMNHYSRAGLRPYHCAMAVSAAMTSVRAGKPEMRWAFTSEYLGLHIGPMPIPLWLIRWTFRRVAVVYDFFVLARREALVMGRAAALRRIAKLLASAPIGLTPEGLLASGVLIRPPAGSGAFLASIAKRESPLQPVGVWEEDDGTLVIRFGEPFVLDLPAGLPRAERDRAASDRVMTTIGRLLPPAYHGAYAGAIAGADPA